MRTCIAGVLLLWSVVGHCGQVRVAVASNFLGTFEKLEQEFERTTGHDLDLSAGSTGQLYAQIVNGAPFDVFLAADSERPRRLAEAGIGVAATQFTYAIGQLALWTTSDRQVDMQTLQTIAASDFRHFAIADPDIAPYGAASRQVLVGLGIWESIAPRLVTGQNIAQAFAWVATGTADIGLVALSQVLAFDAQSSYVVVPGDLHEPIRQDAVLLERAAGNAAAAAFIEFLAGPAAQAIVQGDGYLVTR